MEIVAVCSSKGGCQKSSISLELFAGLVKRGYSCLFLDLDESNNSSVTVGCEFKDRYSIYDVLVRKVPASEAIQTVRLNGYAIPGSTMMASFDDDTSALIGDPRRFQILGNALLDAVDDYDWDFIIMDCMPHRGAALKNALCIADSVIVAVQAEYFGVNGVHPVIQEMEDMVMDLDQCNAELAGFIIGRILQNSRVSREGYAAVKALSMDVYGRPIFGVIPENKAVREAHKMSKTVTEAFPKSKPALAYDEAVDNFLEYLNDRNERTKQIIENTKINENR